MRVFRSVLRGVGVALVAAGVAVGGCSDSGTNPGPNGNENGRIDVAVTADGAGALGVTVRVFPSGSETALATGSTNAAGTVAFTGVEPGSYVVEIVVPADLALDAGQSARRNVTVAAGGVASVSFALVADREPQDGLVEINITTGFTFSPANVTITTGTTVRWIKENTGTFHTVTPRGHDEWERAELSEPGQIFEHTFNTAGSFDYFCEPHEATMSGTITVQ